MRPDQITIAAIRYWEDQDAPSTPFFIDLPIDGEATAASVAEALRRWYLKDCNDDAVRNYPLDGDQPTIGLDDVGVDAGDNATWGHFLVYDKTCLWPTVIASLRPQLAVKLGLEAPNARGPAKELPLSEIPF